MIKKNPSNASSKSYQSDSAEWNCSFSDDVFDKECPSLHLSSNESHDGKSTSVFRNISFYTDDDNGFDIARAVRLGMSTPNSFRYFGSKLNDITGSPHLSLSKKKGLSPCGNSPKLTKSPRLRLFDDPVPENDFPLIPQRNLLNDFNSLSSEEDSS